MRLAVLLLSASLLVAGCGASGSERVASPQPSDQGEPKQLVSPLLELSAQELPVRVEVAVAPGCTEGVEKPMRTERRAYAAVAKHALAAFARPGGTHLATFERLNANDYPTVFGVLAAVLDESCRPAWYRVQLPIRPNGAVGYVRASAVDIVRIDTRIEVDLSQRRLVLYDRGDRVLAAPVAVGAEITPTPTGDYYVNQRLTAPDPWGPFGPAALGISAFSPVLQDWIQGGPIAIHGTNDPSSIGTAASHGCIRVRNDVLETIFRTALAGTPVAIRA